jgi:hypothetical protein
MRRAVIVSIALVALSALAACGPSAPAATHSATATTPPSHTATPSAQAATCQRLAGVNEKLTSLANVSPNTTVGQMQATQHNITTMLNNIAAQLPSDSGPILTQVEAANNQLGATLNAYPANTPISQTTLNLQGFKSNVAAAQTKTTQLATSAKCST